MSVSPAQLAVAVSVLSSRIRNQGLSSREIRTLRDQFKHDQLPLDDQHYISQQYENRQQDHRFYPKTLLNSTKDHIRVGDLVYLYADKDKTHSRPRYLVTSMENEWCFLRKFVGK